ncbi:hypothetical protein NLI96_g1950 [Meripilus lineatus]|uniref:DUF4219 domain-containing protein n=1 Tax=Meripilus lineatus TaxID=2056292 RepID=A0AAD5VBZ8_9APHY|nr:hypothetical protein NLI96_g1950 [Physisporinus lineatus]
MPFAAIISDSVALPKFKPLSSSNYTTWSGEMRAWLMRGGYWMLVKGEEQKPGSLVEVPNVAEVAEASEEMLKNRKIIKEFNGTKIKKIGVEVITEIAKPTGKPTTDESSATLAWSIKAGKAAGELYLALEPN